MRKIKTKNLFFVIVIIAFAFLLSFQAVTQSYIFNPQKTFSIVQDLASAEYEGRKPGTEGNIKSLNYSEKLLNSYGYDVIRQPFNALVPVLEQTPVFEIIDSSNNVMISYIHRKDFKEALGGYSSDGDVTGKLLVDNRNSMDIKGKIFKDSIVIADNDYRGYAQQDLGYIKANVKAIIIPTTDKNIQKASGFPGYDKSQYLNKKEKIVKIYVTYDVFYKLKSYCKQVEEGISASENIKLHISMPIKFKTVETENIVAVLKGTNLNDKNNNKNFLGFSAHIDHLGKDPNGNYFPGALDNASGVAFALEMAKVLSDYKDKLTVNPLIILFNGEENGLLGSYKFVNSGLMDLNKLQLINADMVASSEPVVYNLLFYQGNKPNHPAKNFALLIRSFAAQNNFKFSIENTSGNTDHYYFNEKGYAAVSFNQFPEEFYHTYNDTADKVSEQEFDLLGKLIEGFIITNYTLKNQSINIIYVFSLILLFSFSLKTKKED